MEIIKPAVGKRQAKLLFLMGATWFNKSMFDLDTVGDSFSTCLNNRGIETYTFDIYGSGPEKKELFIGARHEDNVKFAADMVRKYDIDYIMGYSYGCYAAARLATDLDIKGVIFLDPIARLSSSKKLVDNDDKFLILTENIKQDIVDNGGTVNEEILADHIKSLTDTDYFTTAAYPMRTTAYEKTNLLDQTYLDTIFLKCCALAIFTKNSIEQVREMYPAKIFYPQASHWIQLEDFRYKLADDVLQFINNASLV